MVDFLPFVFFQPRSRFSYHNICSVLSKNDEIGNSLDKEDVISSEADIDGTHSSEEDGSGTDSIEGV